MCGSFRRTARALTQRYEDALRPLGLRTTQMTILQVLSHAGEVSQGRLGEMLAMDSTSLTRTLAIMRRHGWVAERRGQDRRERWLRLSGSGKKILRRAEPAWNGVQSRLRSELGDQDWDRLVQLTQRVAGIIAAKGDLT